jgi:hypothetical protein
MYLKYISQVYMLCIELYMHDTCIAIHCNGRSLVYLVKIAIPATVTWYIPVSSLYSREIRPGVLRTRYSIGYIASMYRTRLDPRNPGPVWVEYRYCTDRLPSLPTSILSVVKLSITSIYSPNSRILYSKTSFIAIIYLSILSSVYLIKSMPRSSHISY